ncbi:D-glycero-alpha-D-manno-heptose-1,7-bisphosphate 7-phosphatase [Maricaulis salignorans]|uniref:D,D-heptose 1,7-bisphosphate phosphatase n=2 Tax=Maricaulis salignorans TaxID=144026 RepID=A0A1G9QST5_9PROT|nr:D-glycero-D-manno-heptose 1,7-bisphosphate phosphatase [Maricaulis salignorans]
MPMREPFLVLLDRDGTINIDRHYLGDPAGLEFLPGALDGLTALRDAGAVLAIVTNQSGIGRGMFDREQADTVNDHLLAMLGAHGVEIAHVALCPHAPDEGCDCRKPAPGLAVEAAAATGLPLAQAWVIGDKSSDTGLADAVGARGILITADRLASPAEHFTARDLVEAAAIILAEQ